MVPVLSDALLPCHLFEDPCSKKRGMRSLLLVKTTRQRWYDLGNPGSSMSTDLPLVCKAFPTGKRPNLDSERLAFF
jgi:hypothetical protein